MQEQILSRRTFLGMSTVTATSLLIGESMYAEGENLMAAVEAVDHLLFGINDLDRGIAWSEKTLGVKAVIGGSHPGGGTRNALLSLGSKRYLEIVAPDPEQKTFNFPIDIRNFPEPQFVMWASGTNDIEALAKKARDRGLKIMGPFDGSRARPDGKILKWKTAFVEHQLRFKNVDPIPFFIEWAADSVHPSQDSPGGCTLESLEIEHPQSDKVRESLKTLGLEAKVNQSENAKLIATLKTPKGTLKLS